MVLWAIVSKVLLALALVIVWSTVWGLCKISAAEPNNDKKGTIGLAVIQGLVLLVIIIYHLAK